MKKKVKKIQLRSDAVILNSKTMSNVLGGGIEGCVFNGVHYWSGESFWLDDVMCVCRPDGRVVCVIPEGGPPVVVDPNNGCWCTCKCFEATVVGFQIGMLVVQKQGKL